MSQTCSKCARVNPAEAAYCYFDGVALGGHSVNGGPVNSATQLFANQFVFPSGRVCRNFDQLAVACQENWAEAVDMLQQGFLERFMGGLGRADLALAAREAARFPDRSRGLDQLLAKLPSHVLDAPKLHIEPTEVNLGLLQIGAERTLQLHLANQGMRLLYGSVTCENAPWLFLGEPPGVSQKLFQFGSEMVIPVHVRGKKLRAGVKPLEGRLVIESNGGTAVVLVRAEVPVKPFADGIFAGARTPRQIAEKAKAASKSKAGAKEAAALFESGAVARWYQENGWTYPVQGPVAEGPAAIQQFFDALGLSKPPPVEISERAVKLEGKVGENVRHILELKAEEKRPIYAYGNSDQAWLEVGRAKLNGRTAKIPLVIPSVPDKEGETLQARVKITANGSQRFVVPVTLSVIGSFNFGVLKPPAPVELVRVPEPVVAPPPEPEPVPVPRRRTPIAWSKLLPHLLPVGLLLLALLGVVLIDILHSPAIREGGAWVDYIDVTDREPRIGVEFNNESRFGIVSLREKDEINPDKYKRLTRFDDGRSNNTCVQIDRYDFLFGRAPAHGSWQKDRTGKPIKKEPLASGRGWKSVFDFNEGIRAVQIVEIVPGEQTHFLDTCLVRYTLENRSNLPHNVGIRVMIDTFIGSNDGVPFMIQGEPKLLETMRVFSEKQVPDFIQALEHPDPSNPGTVAMMGLKLEGKEPITEMIICRWPTSEVRWKPNEIKPFNEPADEKDSCVLLYWDYRKMEPNEKREMGFSYGLSKMSGSSGQFGITSHGSTRPEGVFTITAFVRNPQPNQKFRISLPAGLMLEPTEAAEQELTDVVKGKDAQVSWRVRAGKVGKYTVEVSSGVAKEKYDVRINSRSYFE